MAKTDVLARENRIMIESIKCDIKEIKVKMEKTFNHMSSRLPPWATVLFMILTAIIGGLIGKVL